MTRPEGQAGGSDEVKIGTHSVRFEGPDLSLATYRGDVSGEEALAVARALNGFARGKPYILGIVDATQLGKTSSEARRAFLQFTPLLRGAAFIGVSPALQLIGSIVGRAYRLIHRGVDQPQAFCDSEKEARAWVAERRKVLDAEGKPPPQ